MWHKPNDTGAPYVIYDEFFTTAEAGDTRLAKVGLRTAPRQSGQAVLSAYEVRMYAGNTSSVSIIRNEELVLMKAEADINLNSLGPARTSLDKIRTGNGLATLAVAKPLVVTQAQFVDELLLQRKYSLFWEGHRWFDTRRYNKISILPLQGAVSGNTYVVFNHMVRPDSEVQWDKSNP